MFIGSLHIKLERSKADEEALSLCINELRLLSHFESFCQIDKRAQTGCIKWVCATSPSYLLSLSLYVQGKRVTEISMSS